MKAVMGGSLPLAPASSPLPVRVGRGRLWGLALPPLRDAAPRNALQKSLADLEALYGTLSQKAFAGELDLSRVSL